MAAVIPEMRSPTTISFEEFMELKLPEGMRAEWEDGEVIFIMPSNILHQLLLLFIAKILDEFVRNRKLGIVLPGDFVTRLEHSGRIPDVVFISNESMKRVGRTYIDGPVDLAVEIISPDSGERDRSKKYAEYEEAGVKEFWLIDPDEKTAEFFQLSTSGRYQPVSPDSAGRYHSLAIPGLWIDGDWLWGDPHPLMDEVRQAWERD